MTLARPTSTQLFQAAPSVRENYTAARKKKQKNASLNPIRHQLLTLFETAHLAMDDAIKQTESSFTEAEWQDIYFGIWVLCIENLPPEYQEGYLYNSGSLLHKILLEQLKNIDLDYKTLEDKHKFIALEMLHHFIFHHPNHALFTALENKDITQDTVKQQIIYAIQRLLERMYKTIATLENGILSEVVMDTHMANMSEEYKQCKEEAKKKQSYVTSFFSMFTSENPDRLFYTQLCEALASIHIGNETQLSQNELSRSHNIKNGLLLFVIHSIENEYYIRYATNSGFHNACRKILNAEEVENLSHENKALAVAAFQNFINAIEWREYIEQYGRTHFKENALKNIDLKFTQMNPALTQLLNIFLNKQNQTVWPLTTSMYHVGKNLGSIAGYGFGWATGFGVSKTNLVLQPTLLLSQEMSAASAAIIGRKGRYIGFLAASGVVTSTLAYALALALQETGKVVGGLTGAAITLPFEATLKGLHYTFNYFFNVCKDIDPILLKENNVDIRLVQCLMRLPEEAYGNQNRLKYITGQKAVDGVQQPTEDDAPLTKIDTLSLKTAP